MNLLRTINLSNTIATFTGMRNSLIFRKQAHFLFFTVFFLLTCLVSPGCAEDVKEPAATGIFYPSDKNELKQMIDGFLSKAEISKNPGRLVVLISPHAGYLYSGQVAAYGYKEIKDNNIKKVILIGPAHYAGIKGASVYTKGSFRTPLGEVKINRDLAERLLNEAADVRFLPDAYEKEHSLENQLPFLQSVLRDFTIIPILVGSLNRQTFEHLTSRLTEILDENTIIVASSDLSHYHDYATAKEMDTRVISAIGRISLRDTETLLRLGESELCGGLPVLVAMEVARRAGANTGVVFKYANSGDVTGDKDRVVGYSSIGLFKSPYTEEDKKELLSLARDAITGYVTNGKTLDTEIRNPKLQTDGAVFVTIKENNSLRGCIGHIEPVMPLYQSVVQNAIAACSRDTRFIPVKKEELKDIDVEITILSPLQKVKDVKDIQVGKHGLMIRKGMQGGLLLPQVATEFGWDREKFLEQLCVKAGLPQGAWKDADLYSFTAEIIK